MTQLAFSTNAFKKNTFEQALRAIAEIGYTSVELMADLHHAYPPVMTPPRIAQIKSLLDELKLTVSNVNAFTLFACGDTYHPTWIEDDPTQRNLRITHTLNCIELAATFGAKTISLQPGGPLIGTSITRNQAARRFADGLEKILPLAQQHGVTLAIEPEPGLFIQTAEEYLQFKTLFFPDEALIRMNCDIGHLFCVGDDPSAVIRQMPEQIAHVHLEDIGANRVHQHLTPGKGVINFGQVFEALHTIDYARPVTVELYPYETTAAGVAKLAWEHLRQLI